MQKSNVCSYVFWSRLKLFPASYVLSRYSLSDGNVPKSASLPQPASYSSRYMSLSFSTCAPRYLYDGINEKPLRPSQYQKFT